MLNNFDSMFHFYKEACMLAELSFIPVNGKTRMSDDIAEAIKIIAQSGLSYRLTPAATCIEGEWGPVMQVIGRARQKMLEKNSHLITILKTEDENGDTNKLASNVDSINAKLGPDYTAYTGAGGSTMKARPPESLVTPKV
ncbi:MAG: hypothetical protein GF350_04545 [Chitinivibrionales bacterium]|nr:hypothetical protein [Chitinivibrionales bacterium]